MAPQPRPPQQPPASGAANQPPQMNAGPLDPPCIFVTPPPDVDECVDGILDEPTGPVVVTPAPADDECVDGIVDGPAPEFCPPGARCAFN